jgi:hypothetical protein
MAVNLSSLGGAGWQFFDNNGNPLSGGKLYSYAAGTSTLAPTYTSVSGLTANPNPIILNSAGRPPSQVWLDNNATYKFVLTTSTDVLLWTMDNIPGISSFTTTTIANLPTILPAAGDVVFVNTLGREGLFICRAGTAPSDPLQGVYVASNTANFYWERDWDNINGYPEWFGAVVNSNSGGIPAANLAALQACVVLCPVTNLQTADYWISSTWKIQTQYRTVRGGVMSDGYNTGTGTRVLSVNAAANVIQVGPDSAPAGGTSNYFRNIMVENICARWGVALTPPASGSESTAVKAWLINYVLNCQFKNLAAWEPIIGFYLYGTVYTKFNDCIVFRSESFGGTNDFFRGFWAQGVPAILPGANPSLFLTRCNASRGGAAALVSPTGFYANGNFSDIFLDQFETASLHTGIFIDGTGANTGASRLNLHLRHCILDQCSQNGIYISALNDMSMVSINDGYVQVNDTGVTGKGIWMTGSSNNGSVSIGGGIQIISSTGTTNYGIYISAQSNVRVDSTAIIEDFYSPVTIDGGSSGCDIRATINNPNTGNGTSAAVTINSAVDCFIAPVVDGAATKFGQGVFSVGTSLNRTTIDPTMFNSAAISGGAANKVVVNSSVAITAPGYYTTAGVAGSSGAGIFVTGITA